MKRILRLLAAVLIVPAVAQAADLSATLAGQTGQGVGSLVTSGGQISYTLITNGIGTPTRATLVRSGATVLDLQASFAAGSAVGQRNVSSPFISDLEANPGDFTLRIESATGSISGNLASTGGGSQPTGEALLLLDGRLRVQVSWENQFNSTNGQGAPIPSTNFAGFFAFEDPSNIELAVKALDFGDRILFFYGQLTNLFFTITVTDTVTGALQTYSNGPQNCGAVDETAFIKAAGGKSNIEGGRLGVIEIDAITGEGISSQARVFADRRTLRRSSAPQSKAACAASGNVLCLLGNRMMAELTWTNQFDNTSGTGTAVALSQFTGAFAFSDPNNLEVIVKTLDFGNRILVLWGSLSNFGYELKVTDTTNGHQEIYTNPAGTYCGGLDESF